MSTRIVVVSDTHLVSPDGLPAKLVNAIKEADLTVHLGDFISEEVADFLESLGPLAGVHGNCDGYNIRLRYKEREVIEIGSKRIVCVHGHVGGRTARDAAMRERDGDAVLYGHSHLARVDHAGERLMFNPGSAIQRRFAPYCTFGILEVGETLEPVLVPLP
jgi:putative phosphoesterase